MHLRHGVSRGIHPGQVRRTAELGKAAERSALVVVVVVVVSVCVTHVFGWYGVVKQPLKVGGGSIHPPIGLPCYAHCSNPSVQLSGCYVGDPDPLTVPPCTHPTQGEGW